MHHDDVEKMPLSVVVCGNLTQTLQGPWILILFLKIFIVFYLVHRKLISTLEKRCVAVVVL